jgi:hypothetical protein
VQKFLVAAGAALTSLVLAAGATASPAVHEDRPDEVTTGFNPCTGQMTTITRSYTIYVTRLDTDGAGGGHSRLTVVGTVTTADGFSGHFTGSAIGNTPQSGGISSTSRYMNTLGNGSGQRLIASGLLHATLANGEVRVFHEAEVLECRGKPT